MAIFKKKTEDEKKETESQTQEVQVPAVVLPKGGDSSSYQAIIMPHITEKGTMMGEHNKYLFRVSEFSNKLEIKKAIENLYKVKVNKVQVIYTPSKDRQVGKYKGVKAGFKKAVVTLKQGNKIDFA